MWILKFKFKFSRIQRKIKNDIKIDITNDITSKNNIDIILSDK